MRYTTSEFIIIRMFGRQCKEYVFLTSGSSILRPGNVCPFIPVLLVIQKIGRYISTRHFPCLSYSREPRGHPQ